MPHFFNNAVPASVRKPVESSRLIQNQISRRLVGISSSEMLTIQHNRFAALPEEPEDARLTGATRSLNRRLLALNVRGSLCRTISAA